MMIRWYSCIITLDKMLDKLPSEVLHLVLEHLATTPDFVHYENDEQNEFHRSNWKTLAQLCKVS